MSPAEIVLALASVFLGAPVLWSLLMWWRSPRSSGPRSAWDWGLSLASALAYTLAFNLVFFVQELFLVVPKALTPGLRPILFHNDHDWTGANPLAELFQGTGALATVIVGLGFAVWATRRTPRWLALRLFVVWMALLGLLEALPQVLIGTVIPQNDVGRAMAYLHTPAAAKIAGSVAAMIVMALACGVLAPLLLSLVPGADTQGARGRARAAFRYAVLPALAAIALITPFRLPGAPIEVLFPPTVATLVATTWLQAWSWHAPRAPAEPPSPGWSVIALAAALGLLLAFFHLVLRPGVEFY
jgi:hypothetical protein